MSVYGTIPVALSGRLLGALLLVLMTCEIRPAEAQLLNRLFGNQASPQSQDHRGSAATTARSNGAAPPNSVPALPGGVRRGETSMQPIRRSTQGSPSAAEQPTADEIYSAETVPVEMAPRTDREAFGKLVGCNWIWTPAHTKDKVPAGDVYFRRTFEIGKVEDAQVHITADNEYELFVNGRSVGQGSDWRKLDVHEVTSLLVPGKNVVAVRVRNLEGSGPAGLVARVLTKEAGGTWSSFSTDANWRVSLQEYRAWKEPSFPESEWIAATSYGLLGSVLPWGDEVVIAAEGARFVHDKDLQVERITQDEETGSLIAMTFTSAGDVLASQEGGPLLLVRMGKDSDQRRVSVYSSRVETVQGIATLGSRVYVVGNGPDGSGLYELSDGNRDGQAESERLILKFRGSSGEHGPHAVRIGPDGLIYVMVGNFARVDSRVSPDGPYVVEYEGDLVQPRVEDPRGHAVGVPAPGGTVIRTNAAGSFVEIFAGGLRNAYDFAFTRHGDLLTADADMEWDSGMPWYRATRINHLTAGAEAGWRSGWAKWPDYYVDSLPGLVDLGAGSPTGVEYYDHVGLPEKYQGAVLVGDWGRGLIHAVQLERKGASYEAQASVLLRGRPLNITDLAVGPDGRVYFCTGGRGTDGGIYRIAWEKEPDLSVATDIPEEILDQGQLESDWARARVARARRRLGARWDTFLTESALDPKLSVARRLRALDIMVFFGPQPQGELLTRLAADREPEIRGRVAELWQWRGDATTAVPGLQRLLQDADADVRRRACEAVGHRHRTVPAAALVRLLADGDRYVAFAARRALERMPLQQWGESVLSSGEPEIFIRGSIAVLTVAPDKQVAASILQRTEALLRETHASSSEKSIDRQVELMRLAQVALIRGQLSPADAGRVGETVLASYPSGQTAIDNEAVKLLAYLQPRGTARAFARRLAANIPPAEKLQVAAYAPRVVEGWETPDKLMLLRYYEESRTTDGGYSVSAYLEGFARRFFTKLTLNERKQVLASGENFPTSSLSVLAGLPEQLSEELVNEIVQLDQRLAGWSGEAFDRLRVGTVATLGRSDSPVAERYLLDVYEASPQRRTPIAMSLTQRPYGEVWDVLVDALSYAEGEPAREILKSLARVDRRPAGDSAPNAYRNVILQGLRMQEEGAILATALLSQWTEQTSQPQGSTADQLSQWQQWYARQFPSRPAAKLPETKIATKWKFEELLSYLDSEAGAAGDSARGALMFREADCIKCHRMGRVGETLGPDLTTVAQRFQKKEILESILYPSHVISDQYASRQVIANGRTYVGLAMRDGADGVVVLTAVGEKVRLLMRDVEEVRSSPLSAMPEGLLNRLTLSEVADLFAYLMRDGADAGVAGRQQESQRQ